MLERAVEVDPPLHGFLIAGIGALNHAVGDFAGVYIPRAGEEEKEFDYAALLAPIDLHIDVDEIFSGAQGIVYAQGRGAVRVPGAEALVAGGAGT